MAWRLEVTDALVAVGTDVVVVWQCNQRLIELTEKQMAVGVDAVPSSVAASSTQTVLPYTTAGNRAARKGAGHVSK